MRVALLGGSGRTGQIVLEALLKRGHQVTVVARDALSIATRPNVHVVEGDARDFETLWKAFEGSQAVLSALGPSKGDDTLHREVSHAVMNVMKELGIKRYIGIGGAGSNTMLDVKSTRDKIFSTVVHLVAPKAVADKEAELEAWIASEFEWTILRPARLTDKPPTGRIEHDAHRSTSSVNMTRADLGRFMVRVLEERLHVRGAPFVANKK